MRVLEVEWSRALSRVCEVALSDNTQCQAKLHSFLLFGVGFINSSFCHYFSELDVVHFKVEHHIIEWKRGFHVVHG